LPAFAFVPRPFPTNFVLLSTVKVMSLPPAAVTVSELPDTALTVPLAVIDLALPCA